MKGTIGKILDLLTPPEKRRGLVVLAMVLVMALIETAGVASVMPFLAVLGNPEVVQSNEYLAWAFESFGFESTQSFLIVLGTLSFLVVVFGSLFRLFTHYALQRYANMRRHSVSLRLLAGYLRQPYEFFLGRNTADLSKSILSEVDELTRNVFKPAIQLIAYGTSAFVLVLFLFLMDPWAAFAVTAVVGGSYALIYLAVRGILGRIGRDRALANRERFTAASEVLSGIKDIRVLGREGVYLSRFKGPSLRYSKHQATNSVLSVVPKYMIEAVGFGGVLALAVFLMATRGDLGAALPLLGVYAFAGYRLLPAAQQMFASLANLRFGLGAVEIVHDDLVGLPPRSSRPQPTEDFTPDSRQIRGDIVFDRVSYRYPGADAPSLRDISLTVPIGSSLGIVGATGAGKTTLVDVLLGLLPPSSGTIEVDGECIHEAGIRTWQRIIGYVPQHVFLTDASIAENIALGLALDELDGPAVRRAARTAELHNFVASLPDGYETVVGERGVRLSGGQRQRIGVARALYRVPRILVLDEATSALDNRTEARVMENIAGFLRQESTLIVIAHRIGTVTGCAQILVLENGSVAGIGSYEDLEKGSRAFRKVALT